jgi:hypothetical protein
LCGKVCWVNPSERHNRRDDMSPSSVKKIPKVDSRLCALRTLMVDEDGVDACCPLGDASVFGWSFEQ